METTDLLGPLEHTVMEVMWRSKSATVREIHDQIFSERALAYTTVLTVMGNLVNKGLLKKDGHGKSHVYSIALTKEQFIDRECSRAVSDLLERFGDLAVASFLRHTDSAVRPDHLVGSGGLKDEASGQKHD